MPELPEVEVIRRGLIPHLVNKTITGVSYNNKNLRFPVDIKKMLQEAKNHTITAVERRAKYILLQLETGALIIVHLGMTGNLGIFDKNQPLGKHDHLQWSLNDASELRYNDIRRFGSIHVLNRLESKSREDTFFKTSGPEPFAIEFSARYAFNQAKGKQVSVKQFLMNSQIVVGIGNIYANETLFRARIHPERKADKLTITEWQALIVTTQRVLNHAIECGGSTISDFRNASQERGYFQMNFAVYGKEGDPCVNCNAPLKKTKIGGRATFFCSHCQK